MLRALTLCAVGALAIVLIGGAWASAATTLEVDPGGDIEAISLTELEFVIFTLGEPRISCRVTLRLDIGEATKTSGVQFGTVDSARASNCINGATVTFLGLPWRITYATITGELPSEISEWLMEVRNAQFLISTCGWRCLYSDDLDAYLPLFHIFPEEPYVNQLLRVWDGVERDAILGGECPPFVAFLGEFTLEPTQTIVDV